jgi:hypothetical protein
MAKVKKNEFIIYDTSINEDAAKNIILALEKDAIITNALINSVMYALECVSPKERGILLYKYDSNREISFKELGFMIGLPVERVMQIKNKAFKKIRKILKIRNIPILSEYALSEMEENATECFADRNAEYYYRLGYKQALKDLKKYVKADVIS